MDYGASVTNGRKIEEIVEYGETNTGWKISKWIIAE